MSETPRKSAEVVGKRITGGTLPDHDFFYSVIDIAGSSAPPGERRGEKRLRTRLRDGLVKERRTIVDCRITDRSERGARLVLDANKPLPATFMLSDPASRARFTATLIWQDGCDAGVRLVAIETAPPR